MKKIAIYCRISTNSKRQDLDLQLFPLREYAKARGFEIYKEYLDEISWSKEKRLELDLLMEDAKKRKIDWVLVFRFDRFSRSTRHLINTLELFNNLWIDFISYSENIDTSTPTWKVLFTMISAFSEFERSIIKERVIAWLETARIKWKVLWRPKANVDILEVIKLKNKGLSYKKMEAKLNVWKSTLCKMYNEYMLHTS